MGRKVSGFMIKGELSESACEILQMCGVPRSFIYEGIEPTDFGAEVEYEQIKGRATLYEILEPNKFDLEKRNDDMHYEEVSVRKLSGWTIVIARWAFVGIPSDYIESYMSAYDSYHELYDRMKDKLDSYEEYERRMKAVGQRIIELPQTGYNSSVIYERQRNAKVENLINYERRLQAALKGNIKLRASRSSFYTREAFANLLNGDLQLIERQAEMRPKLSGGDAHPRNYDHLKMLSRGGEAIHFYMESLSGSKGFARFVDGKAIDPIWRLGRGWGYDAIFNYETGQWIIKPEFISDDVEFDEVVECELIPKYTSIDNEDWRDVPIYYCYIKTKCPWCPHR